MSSSANSEKHWAVAWIAPVLVALVPVAIASFYPRIIFDLIGGIDPYNFVGVGLDYDQWPYGAIGYKMSRVPWILVEYWFRHALTPLAAQYAIQYFVHILLGVAVYFSLRRLLGIAPAFLAAIFSVAWTELYSATGPDYMNAFSAALYATTFCLVTVAARKNFSWGLYLACGALLALTVHTNILFLVFVPMLLGHTILLRRQAGLPQNLVAISASVTFGVAAATVALGLIATAYGHDFNFMQPQIKFMIDGASETNATWYLPWSSGWWNSETDFGCFLGVAALSVCVVVVLAKTRSRAEAGVTAQISLLLQYVYVFLLFVIVQTTGKAVLQPDHTPFVLIVPCVMALAALIAQVRSLDAFRPSIVAAISAWALILLPLCWHPLFAAINEFAAAVPPFVAGILGMVLNFAVALASRVLRIERPAIAFLATAIVLGVVNVALASPFSAKVLFQPTTCTYDRDGYLAVNDLNRILLAVKPRPTDVYIWLDDNEQMQLQGCGPVKVGAVGWSFRSLGVGALLTPDRETPIMIQWLAWFTQVPYLLVASNDPAAAKAQLNVFARRHYKMFAEPVHIHEGNLVLNFTAIRRPRKFR